MRNAIVAVGLGLATALAVAGSVPPAAAAGASGRAQARPDAAQPAAAGMITGTVLGAAGRPLAGICVSAGRQAGVVTARTAATGRYFLTGLAPGRQSLRYQDCAHKGGFGRTATTAIVTEGQVTRVAPVTLPQVRLPGSKAAGRDGVALPPLAGITWPAGRRRISTGSQRRLSASARLGGFAGRVTDAAGKPVAGICVTEHFPHAGAFIGVSTNPAGAYAFGKYLPPGKYTAQFGACGPGQPLPGNWAPQWYHGAYRQASAQQITIRAGKITKGINAVMRHGGQITGVVTGKDGARLSHVCVDIASANGKVFVEQVKTSHGSYRADSLDPGRYQVYFDPACGFHRTPYLGQWWPGATSAGRAGSVRVRLSKVTAHVDAALRVGGTITGTVRLKNSHGKRLAGICVFGHGSGSASADQPGATTGKSGSYLMEGLPPGRYQLAFGPAGCGNNGNYLYYNDPHPVRVGLGQTVRADVFLQPGAILTGKVTAAATGQPLAGICVFISDEFGDGSVTKADGTFRVDQIHPGRYPVSFSGGCGNAGSYAPQWFAGRTEQFDAAKVTFTGGKVTAGVGAAMRPGAGVSGVVTSKAGMPRRGICVGVFAPSDVEFVDAGFPDYDTTTLRDGSYQVLNLAPGQYQVGFFTCGFGFSATPGWASQWYRSEPDSDAAGLVDLTAGMTVTGISAALAQGGAISGMITDPPGLPDVFLCVTSTSLATGVMRTTEAGSTPSGITLGYSLDGLTPGKYKVSFEDCGGSGLASQWYSGKASGGAANPVTVTAGQVTRKVDANLVKVGPGVGSIAGTVTDRTTGLPVPGICVAAFNASSDTFGRTGTHGRYTIPRVPSGSYEVFFGSCHGQRYAQQVRPGVVHVRAAQAVHGIDFAVSVAGSISGTVSGGSPAPAGRPGVCVDVEPAAVPEAIDGFAVTGHGGRYLIKGLVPGRYQVYFDPADCSDSALPFAPQWYGGQASRSVAQTVIVAPGQTSRGVGAVLAHDGTISGMVTGPAPASTPLSGICVQATPAGQRSGPAVYAVSQSGSYSLTGLQPGKYRVLFSSGCGATGYARQYWQDASSATATAITVAAGSVTTGIDAAMHS